MASYVSDAVIRRLPSYYRHLRELEEAGVVQISSQELGEKMQLTSSQIRQDINSFGGIGRQGYGYDVKCLKEHIREVLGLDHEHRMVVLGAGRIGRAISDYSGFRREGFHTVALFDLDPGKLPVEDIPIWPIRDLEEKLPQLKATIAVIAVPAGAAQEMLDRVYRLGIRAFWNFAPVDLVHPSDAIVVNAHLSDTLYTLGYRMNEVENH